MKTHPPVTRASLAENFARLGISAGQTILVHSSMRAIGRVDGGATSVVSALLDAVGTAGTLVAPTQTLDNRDPSRWSHAPVPEAWWPTIRDHLPPFDAATTPSTGMGAIAEQIRLWPGAVRSAHPVTSFAAIGSRAVEVVADHQLESLLGNRSPLATLECADAMILLLGVGFDKCTAFHLAEYRIPYQRTREAACVMATSHGREWVTYRTVELDDRDFGSIGSDLEATGRVARGAVGAATGRFLSLREAVRFATEWMSSRRPQRSHAPELLTMRARNDDGRTRAGDHDGHGQGRTGAAA